MLDLQFQKLTLSVVEMQQMRDIEKTDSREKNFLIKLDNIWR